MTSNHLNQRLEMETPLEIAILERRCAKRGVYPLRATSGEQPTTSVCNRAMGAR